MKTIEKTVYITDDGKEFLSRKDAEKHEFNLKNIRHYLVSHAPDLTETGRFKEKTLIAVHTAQACHAHILNQYLMKDLGWNAIQEGVMGYGYMTGFHVENITPEEYHKDDRNPKLFLSEIHIKGYPDNINFVEKWGLKK